MPILYAARVQCRHEGHTSHQATHTRPAARATEKESTPGDHTRYTLALFHRGALTRGRTAADAHLHRRTGEGESAGALG